MENTKTLIRNFNFEDLTREDIASSNFTIAVFAYASYFGQRELDTTPCIRRSAKERIAIYNKYKEEIETFLRKCGRATFDKTLYDIRKAQLRGMYSIRDRKGTAVNDMPIFKFIDEQGA